MTHAAVSFHVRRLVGAGYLQLAETRSIRGGKELRYKYRRGVNDHWESEDQLHAVRALSDEIFRRLGDAPGSTWRYFGDAELWVEPQAWEHAIAKISEAVSALHDAAFAPRARGTVHVSASALLFTIESNPKDQQ